MRNAVLENHMVIGPAIPDEIDSGTFNEYYQLNQKKNYQFSCACWLERLPRKIKTLDACVEWASDVDDFVFTETPRQFRSAVAAAILAAGDMHTRGIEPSDNGEDGRATDVCDAILRCVHRV